jgi:hypothetical protein
MKVIAEAYRPVSAAVIGGDADAIKHTERRDRCSRLRQRLQQRWALRWSPHPVQRQRARKEAGAAAPRGTQHRGWPSKASARRSTHGDGADNRGR